jgi:hypothetical protein
MVERFGRLMVAALVALLAILAPLRLSGSRQCEGRQDQWNGQKNRTKHAFDTPLCRGEIPTPGLDGGQLQSRPLPKRERGFIDAVRLWSHIGRERGPVAPPVEFT